MRLDAHVHTHHSGYHGMPIARHVMRESYCSPEEVYRLAKARGMDLVTITDHDQISGALAIADRPDVIIGCEVSARFKDDGVGVHLGVLGLNEAQFAEINRLRGDLSELLPYLRAEGLFVSLNHVASLVNARITAEHIAALMPWIDALEAINGSRLRCQNQTALDLAQWNERSIVAGSDAHTSRGIGRTWVEAPGARTREEFMAALRAGRVTVGGLHGNYFILAEDIARCAAACYQEHIAAFCRKPLSWRKQAAVLGLVAGLPVFTIPFLVGAVHFALEVQFNRSLRLQISRWPALKLSQ